MKINIKWREEEIEELRYIHENSLSISANMDKFPNRTLSAVTGKYASTFGKRDRGFRIVRCGAIKEIINEMIDRDGLSAKQIMELSGLGFKSVQRLVLGPYRPPGIYICRWIRTQNKGRLSKYTPIYNFMHGAGMHCDAEKPAKDYDLISRRIERRQERLLSKSEARKKSLVVNIVPQIHSSWITPISYEAPHGEA